MLLFHQTIQIQLKIIYITKTKMLSESTCIESIPKIDISSLLTGDFQSQDSLKTIRSIDDACRNIGFFSIVNHGISPEAINKMLGKVKEFFYLPAEKKLESAVKKWNPINKNSYRGYFPSSVNGKEGLDIQDLQMSEVPEKFTGLYFYQTNKFPSDLSPDWKLVVDEYYTKLHNLALLLTKVLVYAFNRKEKLGQLQKGLIRPHNLTTLRFNYYPKHEKNSAPVEVSKEDGAELACETHVDSVIFTVLYQDSQGGLQVKSKSGKWITVPFDENAFVVNTGKTTQILTNGAYQATWHRVLMNYHERISIPFFFQPAADFVVDPNFLVEGQAKYKKETYGDFIRQSLKKFKEYARDEENQAAQMKQT